MKVNKKRSKLLDKRPNILERWQITAEELTELIDANPSMRGNMFGYVAEMKLRKLWFSTARVTHAVNMTTMTARRKVTSLSLTKAIA